MKAINTLTPKLGKLLPEGPDKLTLEKTIQYCYKDCPNELTKELNAALNKIPK